MGKKNRDEYLESLEKEIKELKSVNRQLVRRLKKLDKQFKSIEQLTSGEREEADQEIEKERVQRCPACHEGRMREVTFMNRKLRKCSSCEYRTKAEISKE